MWGLAFASLSDVGDVVGVGIFCWWFGVFFVNLQKCYGSFFEKEIIEIFLII